MEASMALAPLLFFIVAGCLIIYIQVLLIRWVFKIDLQLRNQRATVWLLIKLCEKHIVEVEEIQAIVTSNAIK